MSSNEKGDRWERNYRSAFNANDRGDEDDVDRVGTTVDLMTHFFAVRMPSSGSGVTYELPDLHIWYFDGTELTQFAAEVKAGRDRVQFTKLDDLPVYCAATGATPIAIVHIDYEGDFVFGLDELHTTDAGNHSVTKHRDVDNARTFDDFVRSPFDVVD